MAGQTPPFEAPDHEVALAEIDRQVEQTKRTIQEIVAALAEHRGYLVRLTASRKALVKQSRPRRPKVVRSSNERRAGPGNVQAVVHYLTERGPATLARVAAGLGKNNGTVTYAMRAAEEQGLVRKTGKQERRSHEYEAVPRRAVTKPGE